MIKKIVKKRYHALKKYYELYKLGKKFSNDESFQLTKNLTNIEKTKKPYRFDIINFLSLTINAQNYLEIGVRNPADNFNLINISNKYSVDPGVEFELNPVDFKMTSDDFFSQLSQNSLKIPNDTKFDVIFIDGLHLAQQVEKDIFNSIQYLSEDGFIVLHDCNPPSEHHARETYSFYNSPAGGAWNGTTWKAFVKARMTYNSCCIDSDWGVGIISKSAKPGLNILKNSEENHFYEYSIFNDKRKEFLNLLSFESFTQKNS